METKMTRKKVNLSEATHQEYILRIAGLLSNGSLSPESMVEKLDELMDWLVYDAVIAEKDDVRDIDLRLRCYVRAMDKGYTLLLAQTLYTYIKEQTALLADA